MAPNRSKEKGKARATPSHRPSKQDGPSDIYADMLAEAAVTDPTEADIDIRPLKKRRLAATSSKTPQKGEQSRQNKVPVEVDSADERDHHGRNLQTIEASTDSDGSDFEFEDVDLGQAPNGLNSAASDDGDDLADVTVSVDAASALKRRPLPARRKPASVAEKAQRLIAHKAHFLCLLGHCIYINSWCNNEAVHRSLENVLTSKTKVYLSPKASLSQFERDRSFMNGLREASDTFRGSFKITASGMRRTNGENDLSDVEPVDRAQFMLAAKRMHGSQDTANQLFCALLRSVGVEARLACSLQTMSLSTAPAKPSTPRKPAKPTVFAIASDTDPMASDTSADDVSVKSSASMGKVPSVRRRLGQPAFSSASMSHTSPQTATTPERKKSIRKLAYPLYWVEAFNAAHQKWIPVDPIVTQTVNKAAKIEPPSSYEYNQMSYVIALESDGVAKDVTRRYAKAYNAKTRRSRVESTENGAIWLKKALRFLRRRGPRLDRDQVEDAELAQKEAREGLPTNVVDFKDHPYYALERHIRRHEVLHPRREVGRVNAGTARNPKMEAVFRRQDVVACRSADRWFRVGREVKEGEQPLKRVVTRRRAGGRTQSPTEDGEAGMEQTTALYAVFQTSQYVPPPVVRGKVPRNNFGNLDVYVPSMVPAGGTHIRHALAKEAAALLKVDFVDAVTGFTFKGRQGTAVVEGGVVASENVEAITAAIGEILEAREEATCRNRSLLALRMWKRFLTGLRIAERVQGYREGKGKEVVAEQEKAAAVSDGGVAVEVQDAGGDDSPLLTAGKYTIEQLLAPAPMPSAKKQRSKRRRVDSEEDDDDDDDGAMEGHGSASSENDDPVRTTSRVTRSRKRAIVDEEDDDEGGGMDSGGGFLPDDAVQDDPEGGGGGFILDAAGQDDLEGGGGFMPEEDEQDTDKGGGGFMMGDAEMTGPDEDDAASEAGGGFVSGNPGGGFLAEDEPTGDSEVDEGRPSQEQDGDEGIGGVMPSALDGFEAGDLKASVAQEDKPDPQHQRTAVESAPTAANLDDAVGDDEQQRAVDHAHQQVSAPIPAVSQHNLVQVAVEQPRPENIMRSSHAEGEDDEDDRDSLLSHDPEDDDAEPDWLESD